MLSVNFVTVAHNSMPFIRHHIDVFTKLKRPWTWRVCEGVTPIPAWFNMPGKITDDMHRGGLSNDGTHEYLLSSPQFMPFGRMRLYRNDAYLTEKFQLMLADVKDEESIVVQVDCDEFWTAEQIETLAAMFEAQPDKQAAWFFDRCFVGPRLCLARGDGHSAGNQDYEWRRAWRWRPDCKYVKHDPPVVTRPGYADITVPPASFFTREETAAAGLVFNHYAYVLPEQVKFKETRYGFIGALDAWRRMQDATPPFDIHDYLPWLGHGQVEAAPDEHCWKLAEK